MRTPDPITPFTLDPTFIQHYRTRKPPFGFGVLSEIVFLRTYSRLKTDGTNEQWFETVQRVVEGTYTMQKRWILGNSLRWDERKAQRSAQEMYDRIYLMKFLPPGRGLWAMGSALTNERGLAASLLNCAFHSTEFIDQDPITPFTFLMEASMLGIGCGFDTKGAGKRVVQAPGVGATPFVVPDTREGWVDSLAVCLRAYFFGEPLPAFDYSLIRPAGAPIKGFGGTAAGPGILKDLHDAATTVLAPLVDQPITVRAIVDLMNLIGKCVVSGNLRRTAEIAFGSADSEEFLNLKNYELHPERAEYGWTSNNSVFADLGMDYTELAKRIAANGEPGVAWLENMRAYSRMGDEPDWADKRVAGGNPCLEQSLENAECCCLVETFPAKHDTLEDYVRTLKFAYLYAKTVTLGTTPWPETNQVMLRNRRIGLSQSGIVQAISKLGMHEYLRWCEEGYETVREYDAIYSDWLAIPRSIKVTSVKPSGSVSLLAGATPGLHYPEARFYIRRIRLSTHSELIPPLQAAGYHIEPAFGSEATTVVVEIPVAIEDDVRTASEVSLWEQLALTAFMQRHWSDNQVSSTVTFDPTTEAHQIAPALDIYQYQLKGVSFLPRVDAGAYPQMPYEAISEARYRELAEGLLPLRLQAHEEALAERFCDGDSCLIL